MHAHVYRRDAGGACLASLKLFDKVDFPTFPIL
jgi:hypothetical protein